MLETNGEVGATGEVTPNTEMNSTTETNETNNEQVNPYKEDMFKYKKSLRAEKEQRLELESRLREIENRSLEEKQEYKSLWESEKKRAEEASQKAERIQSNYLNGVKRTAIEQEALKLGITENSLEFLNVNTDMVELETTSTGNVNVLGASDYVESFKTRHPNLFKTNKAPNVHHGIPEMNKPKELSNTQILELQRTNPAEYRAIMKKRLGIA